MLRAARHGTMALLGLRAPPTRSRRSTSTFLDSITPCDVVDFAEGGIDSSIQKLLGGGQQQRPFIVKNYLQTIWGDKCLRNWRDPTSLKSHLLSKGLQNGKYIVKCEFGGDYMDKDMTVKSVCLIQLLDYFIYCEASSERKNANQKAYLAQFSILNDDYSLLLDDVKPLPLDIIKLISSYTSNRGPPDSVRDNVYNVNIWFNGVNNTPTASPCHYDPYHNLLCQISGEKRVLLISDDFKDCAYLHDGIQRNTSAVNFDVINIDKDDKRYGVAGKAEEEKEIGKYPLLFNNKTRSPTASIAILSPGDALYIPLRWLHYCKSYDRSMSTNVWWL